MPTIAYLSSRDMLPGSPNARPDRWELDVQWAALEPACRALDLRLELRAWDDPGLEEAPYDAFVIGTTWDYFNRAAEFLALLDRLAERAPVLNSPALVRWNADKGYLRELASRGVATVPTRWVEALDDQAAAEAFLAFDTPTLVAKPVVGAGAARQVLLHRGEPLPAPELCPPGATMLQPFLPSIQDEGELSLLFIGEDLSHALRKRPARGDYRVQACYGGAEQVHRASLAELELARTVLGALPEVPLYARLDLVRGLDGQLAVIELELIEPYLYPEQGPELGALFARALRRRLG
jgi:glutathione synthase/RimK-type ligase-like ATP-grasp enzyme